MVDLLVLFGDFYKFVVWINDTISCYVIASSSPNHTKHTHPNTRINTYCLFRRCTIFNDSGSKCFTITHYRYPVSYSTVYN